jgi:outer membrane lipoprotein-sorting protein
MAKLPLVIVAALLVLRPSLAPAQTADEIIEKHLAASGGREAMSKLQSRTARGTITLGTPVGELAGTIVVYAKAPNKSRTLIKIDVSAFGAGEVLVDQRFDGNAGYVIDTFNGNRDVQGSQLEAMRNGWFPSPLLGYKDRGATIELKGQDTLGGKPVYVLTMSPKTGPTITGMIDAETFMLVRTSATINVPELGGDVEQVSDFYDFRDVDGVKVAFATRSSNAAQTITVTLMEVQNNTPIDDASFSKPVDK